MGFFDCAQNDRKNAQNDRKNVQNDRKNVQKDSTFYCHIERNEMESKYLTVYRFEKWDSSTALRMTGKKRSEGRKKRSELQ